MKTTHYTAPEYAQAVAASETEHACHAGHPGCALWDNGPCSDELLSAHEAAQTPKEQTECPNCGHAVTEEHAGCILHAMIDCIRDRGTVAEDELLKLHTGCDVDSMWGELGPIIDQLEEGAYL